MPRRTLRILCFGNSLTSGFPVGKPYAEKLTEKLEEALLGHGYGEIQYEVEGVPGDLVTRGSFLDRMRDSCEYFYLRSFSTKYIPCSFRYLI